MLPMTADQIGDLPYGYNWSPPQVKQKVRTVPSRFGTACPMAKPVTKTEQLRAQKARLRDLRSRKHEEFGKEHRLTWWANEYGIAYQTLKKAAAGQRPLQPDDALTIARYHGVTAQFVLYGINEPAEQADAFAIDEPDTEDTVPVLGWVSAGSQVVRTPLNESVLDRIPAPPGSNSRTRALEIRGDSLGELFDRWFVIFDDEQRAITPDLLNKLCVVELSDGRVLVKKIKRGGRAGRFDLLSNTEPPIENVQIKWAARVKHMAPR